MGVSISLCRTCGCGAFPPRLVCERCHGTDLRTAEMSRGTVEQMTTVSTGEHIATVRVADGVPIVVRATRELHPGAAVELDEVRALHGARAIEARPLEGTYEHQ
jgi:uncharacterized OB-fold protein